MKKKLFPTILALVCAVCCMFSLVACDNGDDPQEVAVTSVALNKTEITLEIGGEETLTATVTPDNATNKAVTWVSDNPNVADVDNGRVTAKTTGTAVITAKTGYKSATCTVTVSATPSIVLAENTDFSAIESEKVTESEWRAAFAESTYTNVTIKTTKKDDAENPSVWKHTQNMWLIESEYGNQYMIETTDKFVTIYSGTIMDSDKDYVGIEYDDPEAKQDWDWQCSYTVACPDFSDYFSDFTYDETLKAYTLNGEIELPYGPYEYMPFHYAYGIIKIVNGRLAYVYSGEYETDSIQKRNDFEIFFYNFDITEISVPNYTLMDSSEAE